MIPETIPFIPEPFRRHRIFCVPSGIGDFAWIYAKLTNYGEPFVTVHSDDLLKDRVNRALPFVQLLPKVAYEIGRAHV